MSKKRAHPLVFKQKPSATIHVDPNKIKVRKPFPPTTKTHRDKTTYRRSREHPDSEG